MKQQSHKNQNEEIFHLLLLHLKKKKKCFISLQFTRVKHQEMMQERLET